MGGGSRGGVENCSKPGNSVERFSCQFKAVCLGDRKVIQHLQTWRIMSAMCMAATAPWISHTAAGYGRDGGARHSGAGVSVIVSVSLIARAAASTRWRNFPKPRSTSASGPLPPAGNRPIHPAHDDRPHPSTQVASHESLRRRVVTSRQGRRRKAGDPRPPSLSATRRRTSGERR